MTTQWTGSSGGVDWTLQLPNDGLLPGRLVDGRVTLVARRAVDARGLVVTLRGEEHWKYHVTTTDSQGHTHTETRNGRVDLSRVPVLAAAPHTPRGSSMRRHPWPPGNGPTTRSPGRTRR